MCLHITCSWAEGLAEFSKLTRSGKGVIIHALAVNYKNAKIDISHRYGKRAA